MAGRTHGREDSGGPTSVAAFDVAPELFPARSADRPDDGADGRPNDDRTRHT